MPVKNQDASTDNMVDEDVGSKMEESSSSTASNGSERMDTTDDESPAGSARVESCEVKQSADEQNQSAKLEGLAKNTGVNRWLPRAQLFSNSLARSCIVRSALACIVVG